MIRARPPHMKTKIPQANMLMTPSTYVSPSTSRNRSFMLGWSHPMTTDTTEVGFFRRFLDDSFRLNVLDLEPYDSIDKREKHIDQRDAALLEIGAAPFGCFSVVIGVELVYTSAYPL